MQTTTATNVGMRKRVTISQLADTLGLTKGTVSRAMNGYPDISDSTRQRVVKQAERMGYRPLSHAQAIRTGRTRSIGLVLQMDTHDAERPFLADFIAGVTQTASSENWTLTVATAASKSDMLGAMERLIDERKADGFILPRTKVDDERVTMLRRHDVPFVLFGRTGDTTGCAWYDVLGEDAMEEAVLRLAGLGHTRIGFVNSDLDYNYAVLREGGFRTGMKRIDLLADDSLIRHGAMTPEQGAAATLDLLAQTDPPTALVFATDKAALGAYAACARLGLQVGRELSVISYDGAPEGAYANPPLTTFNVDTRASGARLAALLIERIRGTDPDTLREGAHARLLPRGSDRAPTVTSPELARLVRTAHLHPNEQS